MIDLIDILKYKRPACGLGMLNLRENIISVLEDYNYTPTLDGYGNLIVHAYLDLGQADTDICFTAHLDTVHREEGLTGAILSDSGTHISVPGQGGILGADDGVGVYILLHMLRAHVPGLYIFTLDEEIGGMGSSWIAEHTPELFDDINIAVGFDRKGYNDIVVNQMCTDTASNTFAWGLASLLEEYDEGLTYSPARGIYTDTAEWSELVPECTNLSVGYFNEHTTYEYCDIDFADQLIDAVINIDWDNLHVERVVPQDVVHDPEAFYRFIEAYYPDAVALWEQSPEYLDWG